MDDDQFVTVEQTITEKTQKNQREQQATSQPQQLKLQTKKENQEKDNDEWVTSDQARDDKQMQLGLQNFQFLTNAQGHKASLDLEFNFNAYQNQSNKKQNQIPSQGFIEVEGQLVSKQNIQYSISQGFLQINGNLDSRKDIQVREGFLQIQGELVSKKEIQNTNQTAKLEHIKQNQQKEDQFEFVQTSNKPQTLVTDALFGKNFEQIIQLNQPENLQEQPFLNLNHHSQNHIGLHNNQAQQYKADQNQDQFAQGEYQQSPVDQQPKQTEVRKQSDQFYDVPTQQIQPSSSISVPQPKQEITETKVEQTKKEQEEQEFGDFQQQTQNNQGQTQSNQPNSQVQATTILQKVVGNKIKQDYSQYSKQVQQFLYKLPDYSFITTKVFL